MGQNKLSQSEIDGVQYRRAKLWQIIMVAASGLVGMGFYSLIGMASYSASIGFGIATVAVGGILTFTRIFDAITDPLLAFVYDKVNTRFGKVRVLLVSGWLIMALATLMMYNWAAGKGHGVVVFVLLYVIYIIGYTLYIELKDKYQKVYGPLSIYYPCNKWRWLEEPWPWEGGNF